LRPDTLYADERYANITQPEINAAKARIAERNLNKPKNDELKTHPQYDFLHNAKKQEPLLYP
jgi:hypothetical protein